MDFKLRYEGEEINDLLGKAATALQEQDIRGLQEKLISGENIKTINGTSILGKGNIIISGGGDSGYRAKINLSTPQFNAVLKDSSGHYIEFTFDTTNEAGNSIGEGVTCTYTITRGTNQNVVTEKYRYNTKVRFGIDKYLQEGSNDIVINIIGDISGLSTSIGVTFQVVNLALDTQYDLSTVHDLSHKSYAIIEIPFTLSGYGTKIIEWYIDGEMLNFDKSDDEVVDVIATRTKYITISNLSQGTHSLQIRAYTVVNGEVFYTDTRYYDIIVYTGVSQELIVGVSATIPSKYGILDTNDTLKIYNAVQYKTYTLEFATYSPTSASSTLVSFVINNDVVGQVSSSNGIVNEFRYTPTTYGSKTLILRANNKEYIIPMIIEKTSMQIDEITTALALDFSAKGRTNNSTNKDSWSFGNYTGTFSGFNWNNTSGWVNGRLEMNAGSSIGINYAPLASDTTNTGKTIEIEWMTKNVSNDDAIICDLRGDDGVGILITATKVSMTSADGVVVETEYKSEENVRVGFVINKSSGVTNQRLSFIYANGIVSRGEKWAIDDNYLSDKQILFTATADAEISLKSIRIYDTALTSDQMLNNYILYRDSVSEMIEVYDRNDIYVDGTTTFSPDKMMTRLPVMIVTGDIPVLENTSDKDTQIVVDIEYHNLQNRSKSFKMKGAAMRPQGTSSMGYPKKNFRIYTEKVDGTILYDADGNVVEDKLYAFTDKAQPVNCWCLKADYAESSGTHNTGIARLWNNALMNVQIDGEYVCRTEAQKKAIEAKYEYDVRTTIDGFPILLFYRPSENDNVIFIGKYNFNNDKSTESVFGFTGIPNFDNSKMQCWEVLNNGNALALFTTTEGFDEGWTEAFESRYPDTKTPYTGDLKAFCQWMTNVSAEDFATQKWEHLNVYMMAAYWVYLMRHAAADQFVKNAMFTSEDGQHFYYILYDNDTINGLINTGRLRIKPTDNRQTVDETGSYVFAGHDSRLWNMLEADEEFIDIVSAVDNALYSAGISYANTIRIFDEEQADKWVEKVYNQDAQYKYVGPYTEKGINNLFMLQGKRDLHRRWWLAKRFSIYDAKYVSGTYKSQAVEVKCLNGTEAGQKFSIVAGYPLDYGYGINNVPRDFGVSLEVGESYEFTTEEVVNVGDPVRIYGAPNIAEIDFSKMADRLAVVTIANVYDENLGTKLTKLVLGNASKANHEVSEISGLKQASALEYLDVQGMTNIESLDLSNHKYFKTLKAFGSGISSATFAKGAPVERLELPSVMRALNLNQLPYLASGNIAFEDIANLAIMNVTACPSVSNNFAFIYNWFISKTTANKSCSLIMDNVLWENVDPTEFLALCRLKLDEGVFQLKGKISIPSASVAVVNTIKAIFGETAFLPDAELYIEIPESLILEGPSRVVNGKSGIFVATAIPVAINQPTYHMIVNGAEVSSIAGVATLNANTGVLSVNADLAADTSVSVRAKFLGRDGVYIYSPIKEVAVAIEVRPTSIEIVGDDTIYYKDYIYTYNLNVLPSNANVEYNVEWGLSENDYIEIVSSDNQSCVIKVKQETSLTSFLQSLSATLVSVDGETTLSTYKQITLAQVKRPTSLVFDAGNEEIQFEGNYNYVVRPNITPINVSLAYDTPTLSGTAVSQGKVSLVSSTNGAIVVKVNLESTEDLYFAIRQSATVSGGGATLEVVKQVTLVHVVRPTSVTIEGKGTITAGNHTYTAVLSPSTANVPMTYSWSVSGSSNVSLEASNTESCVLVADTPDEDETFVLTCTATSADGKTTVSATLSGTVQAKLSYIIATYNVTSTTSATQLLHSSLNMANVTYMEVDGVEVTPALSYTFSSTGTHVVKFTLETLQSVFRNVTTLTHVDFSECNGSKYDSLYDSFRGCYALTSIEWGECTFPKVTTLAFAFYSCSALTSLDLSPFAGAPIKDLTYAFYSCSTLTSIDLSPFAGATITSLNNTFNYCSALTSIDLSPFAGATITNLAYAFYSCKALKTIIVPWTTAPTSASNTFGASTSTYTGRNTYNTGQNMLIVPTGATGYDEGYWGSALLNSTKCGFTIRQNGVYIQHTNGALYTESEWTSKGFANTDANGVAVLSEECSFVIAKEYTSSDVAMWSEEQVMVSGVSHASNGAEAILDFDGYSNSEYLNSSLYPAAYNCKKYTFPNGNNGYLPAGGEWHTVYNNRSVVISALETIGGEAIGEADFRLWTSTQHSKGYSFFYVLDEGSCNYSSQTNDFEVRAFTTLF